MIVVLAVGAGSARVRLCLRLVEFAMLPLRYEVDWQGEPWRQQVLHREHDPNLPLQGSPHGWLALPVPPKSD